MSYSAVPSGQVGKAPLMLFLFTQQYISKLLDVGMLAFAQTLPFVLSSEILDACLSIVLSARRETLTSCLFGAKGNPRRVIELIREFFIRPMIGDLISGLKYN